MTDAVETPLRIFAPGSLSPVQEAILAGFRKAAPAVRAEFASPAYSGVLAQQIHDGAPADVFISANTRYLDDLHAAGLAPQPYPLARNRLVLVSRTELKPPLAGVAAFAQRGLRIVIPPPIDPLGEYALEMLERAGLTDAIARKREQGEVREHLASLRTWLDEGEVDAAVLYASMADSFSALRITHLPQDLDMHERVVFGIGVIARHGRSHRAAGRFVDWMRGAAGQAVLHRGGFLPLT